MSAWRKGLGLAGVLCGCWAAGSAWAVGPGDSFSDGVAGWNVGGPHPSPPIRVADGGPGGVGDAYLQIESLGGAGPGSRLTVSAGPQWSGNYLAAGVTQIQMQLRNLGDSALSLHLILGSAGGNAITATPVLLAPGGGWQSVQFSLLPANLVGNAGALADVVQLRLFHADQAVFPGPALSARLGIDNVSAVPEPSAAVLLGAGLLALGLRRGRAHAFSRSRSETHRSAP